MGLLSGQAYSFLYPQGFKTQLVVRCSLTFWTLHMSSFLEHLALLILDFISSCCPSLTHLPPVSQASSSHLPRRFSLLRATTLQLTPPLRSMFPSAGLVYEFSLCLFSVSLELCSVSKYVWKMGSISPCLGVCCIPCILAVVQLGPHRYRYCWKKHRYVNEVVMCLW